MHVNTSFVVSIEGTEHMCMHITLFTGSSPEKWGRKEAGNSKKTIHTSNNSGNFYRVGHTVWCITTHHHQFIAREDCY